MCGLCILMHVNLKHALPSCAAAERVFSLLSNSFKENQQNALETIYFYFCNVTE